MFISSLIADLQIKMNKSKTERKKTSKKKSHVSLIYEESCICDDVDSHEDCQLDGAAGADATSRDGETFCHQYQHQQKHQLCSRFTHSTCIHIHNKQTNIISFLNLLIFTFSSIHTTNYKANHFKRLQTNMRCKF